MDIQNIQKNEKNKNNNDIVHILHRDHPEYETGREHYEELHTKEENTHFTDIIGSMIFFTIFVIIGPILLKRFKNEELLLSYLANLDLIATALQFKNGPFGLHWFRYLYEDDRPLIGFFNQNLINYFVLLAVSYIIISTSVKSRNIGDGMGKVSIILVVTYLFTGRIISEAMHAIDNQLINSYNINPSNSWNITFIFGLLIALLFILLEAYAINRFYKSISKFFDTKVFKFFHLE
tara:strand:+ start:3635 stop:4339 length:705 start_codon:yes stop_codon:yes gene_type:complete